MNKYFRKLVALAFVALALDAATFAQDFAPKVRAHIPFPFYAGRELLQPGDYTLAVNRQNRNVAIVNFTNRSGMFLLGSSTDDTTNGTALLIFQRNSEGIYALQKVQAPDIAISFASVRSPGLRVDGQPVNDRQVLVAQALR